MKYSIVINKNPGNDSETHHYMYPVKVYGEWTDVSIYINIGLNMVNINFKHDCPQDEDIKAFKSPEVKDAMRKAHLAHMLLYGTALVPDTITLKYGNETIDKNSDNDINFPFELSMFRSPKDYSINTYSMNLVKSIIDKAKANQDSDYRYCCLYSFLTGLGRGHYIDQFMSYWTAINAFYNLLARYFNKRLKADDRFSFLNSKEKEEFLRIVQLLGDRQSMNGLAYLFLVDGGEYTRYNCSDKECEVIIIEAMKDFAYCLRTGGLNSLLEESKKPNSTDKRIEHIRTFLKQYPKQLGVPDVYTWITFRFAYLFRCKYIHGARIFPAVANYDDIEIISLKLMCYFMRDFLDNNIERLFTTDDITDEEYEKLLKMLVKYGVNKYSESIKDKLTCNGYL